MRTSKKVIAAALAAAAIAGAGAAANSSVHADPAQLSAFVGVGSDTVQDVTDAFMGMANNVAYTPLRSSTNQQIISYTATLDGKTSTCITTKLNGGTFTRPNGSTEGRKALSQAAGLNGVGWTGNSQTVSGVTYPVCSTLTDTGGSIDFARTSSFVTTTTGDLTYIPFGRDGVSFAAYRKGGSPVTDLTASQLTTIFTASSFPVVIGGVNYYGCGIQDGSGTQKFWSKALTGSESQFANVAGNCGGKLQENDPYALKTAGDAYSTGDQVVIGFSAAAYAAKANGVALQSPAFPTADVKMGSIAGVAPLNYDSITTKYSPNSTFYASSTFGRLVGFVLPTTVATGGGNASIKSLFVNNGTSWTLVNTDGTTTTSAVPAICRATDTITKFGFQTITDGTGAGNCGSTYYKGAAVTGAS